MKARKVIKPFSGSKGQVFVPGACVDVAQWRNADSLERAGYLTTKRGRSRPFAPHEAADLWRLVARPLLAGVDDPYTTNEDVYDYPLLHHGVPRAVQLVYLGFIETIRKC